MGSRGCWSQSIPMVNVARKEVLLFSHLCGVIVVGAWINVSISGSTCCSDAGKWPNICERSHAKESTDQPA